MVDTGTCQASGVFHGGDQVLLLSSMELCVLRLLLTVLNPLIYVQKKLEPNKVIGSLAVLLIWEPRTSLIDVLDDLRERTSDADEADVSHVRAILLPGVQAFLKDFNSHWSDGSGIMVYKESPRSQPLGLHPDDVIATALDLQCKRLYDISDTEHDDVWRTVVETTVDIALTWNRHPQQAREARSRQTKSTGMASIRPQRRETGRRGRSD